MKLKNNILKRYLTIIAIYTLFYALFLFFIAILFNGIFLDLLYNFLSYRLFSAINHNREAAILLVYIVGVLIISVIYVFKLSKYLALASRAITEDNDAVFGPVCPEELRDFDRQLKEFKYNLKENERARAIAEQQKNDLVVYLAHDLKTPLTSIIGYLSLLEESPDLPTEYRAKYTGIALDKAYRLETLINEFFEITRLNLQTIPTNHAPVNLTILLTQISTEFFPMLEEKGIELVNDVEEELLISADADKLARVFDNLFRNAVNYSASNTVITCSAHRREGFIEISVKNQGETIPPEKLCRIFDKFYRLDSSRASSTGGSGLGLAIAKQLVELHGGNISVQSIRGETVFTVTLPL
ncbi:MAG: GHKL domain-containing protein [Clostridia bacterium]|nr:GHKL domain-containing protein [Clostridia bacterium]